MNFHALISNGQRLLKANAPSILTGIGVAGTISTAVLAAKGAFKACRIMDHQEHVLDRPNGPQYATRKDRAIRRTKLTWQCYIPAASTGLITVVAIVGSNKINAQRTAAAITAYSLTETAFAEYKNQVMETVGRNKEEKIRDKMAADRVAATAPDARLVLVGNGDVLCCEMHTGRYFMSTMEKLRRAMNNVNEKMTYQRTVDLGEFYDDLDIPGTSTSSMFGWDLDGGFLVLEFSHAMTDDDRPCITFNYNYLKAV